MPKYAVKIGEIHLVSDRPITAEEYNKTRLRLLEDPAGMVTNGAVTVKVGLQEAQD